MINEERLEIFPTNSRGESFEPDELFVYVNGNKFELGKVKRVNNSEDGYFCYYHTGDTAANTNVEDMHKLANAYCIEDEKLGGRGIINKEKYSMFEAIRTSGITNMLDIPVVIEVSNHVLSREDIIELTSNYKEYTEKYGKN